LGDTRIRLGDPEIGEFDWELSGRSRTGTREEYLEECYVNEQFKHTIPALYRLAPRTKGKRGADHAGFKGMTFSDDGDNFVMEDGRVVCWHEMFWCDPRFGIRFQKSYEEYTHEHFHGKPSVWPYHPYLFINIEKQTYGQPMTLAAVRGAWKRALKRIGMSGCGLGPHSLRHMFGEYCASVLKMTLEETRVVMHHASTASTEVYFHMRSKDVRDAINKAVAENAGVNITDYMILPGTPPIQLPEIWSK